MDTEVNTSEEVTEEGMVGSTLSEETVPVVEVPSQDLLQEGETPISEVLSQIGEVLSVVEGTPYSNQAYVALQEILKGCSLLASKATEVPDIEGKNREAFKVSPSYLLAFQGMKMLQEDLTEMPEAICEKLFEKWEKPYKAGDNTPTLEVSGSFLVKEKAQRGRPSVNTASAKDAHLVDEKHPARQSRVYYEVYWQAFCEDYEFASLIPSDCKGKLAYQGGAQDRTLEALIKAGKLTQDDKRGFVSKWAKAQKVTKDGNEVPRFSTVA